MKRLALVMLVGVVAFGIAIMGCMDRKPGPVCPVPTEINKNEKVVGGFEGLDMLVVVDDSSSMGEEQQILSTAFFPLINSLVNPLPDWEFEAADNMRVAIVSSDMGLQYGPDGDLPAESYSTQFQCPGKGKNGEFQTYTSGASINILPGEIPCSEGASQCPAGPSGNWTCDNIGNDGVGVCNPPSGDGTAQVCPGLGATYAQTPRPNSEEANPDLAFQVACLADLGTGGCGFEQQLQAAAKGLFRAGQGGEDSFIRDEALLAVMIVSDEEDCSIENGDLFGVTELNDITQPHKLNIACSEHPNMLFSVDHYKTTFINAKEGRAGAVIFAAIAGVPYQGGAADDCQGRGSDLGNCLDHSEMDGEPVLETGSSGTESWVNAPACRRLVGDTEVTKARPGRRYVELAESMDTMSYVYSICNADWSPAMEDIAELIAENMSTTCYPKPLDWDPTTEQAKCDVVVEYINQECPFDLADGDEATEEERTDSEGVEYTITFCPLPRLPAPLDCAQADKEYGDDDFGWYYCEDHRENFNDACEDGMDNDGDGDADCDDTDDSGCANCQACGGTGVGCAQSCKFAVQLTPAAEAAIQGQQIAVQCLQQFSFEDENCQENTEASCNDDKDNDGNGVWDCNAETEGDAPHGADANCCPMSVGANRRCVVNEATWETNCTDNGPNNLPDACVAAAQLLQCQL
ncbi:MAG: hypothetical protein JRI55_37895 [Deltaproteobacteria bacterium]|jgi:hypothetical protein|nr:hypothetical protein [Deltaproteobacteria bacterium]